MRVNEARVVDAHEVENCGVQIVDVELVLGGAEAEIVGAADGGAGFDAAACHPHGEAGGIVVASVAFFTHRRAAELTAPDDERFIEQAAGFEIAQQTGDGFVLLAAVFRVVGFDLGVRVPLAAAAVVELHEAHAALDEATRQQAVPAHDLGLRIVDAVELFDGFRFALQIDGFRRFRLHAKGEFVGADAGVEFGVVGARGTEVAVQFVQEGELALLA